ncbi:MAG: DnaJ domain-containing protein [Firmicutes bacterium]|jgi:DnaJ-class molecular chaperone|nr:DnaJ domain-containing protein [Bacillota bacterium]
MAKDYYQILGVNEDAGQEQIKAAYRKLAFQYHPDRNKGDAMAAEKMKDINEAYAVLSDRIKRKEYDTFKDNYGSSAFQRYKESYSEEDIFRGSDINQIFEEMSRMFGFRDFDEIFKEFYGSRYETFAFRRPGYWGRGFIFRGFTPRGDYKGQQGKYQGDKEPFSPTQPFAGILNRFLKHRLGKAFGVTFPERGRDLYDRIILTPEQAERGGKVEYSFQKWGTPRKILVKLPPKISEGQRIRLKGMGAEGKGGGEAGDLYLEVKIQVSLLQKIKSVFKINKTQ